MQSVPRELCGVLKLEDASMSAERTLSTLLKLGSACATLGSESRMALARFVPRTTSLTVDIA